jgi:hypothetical protein
MLYLFALNPFKNGAAKEYQANQGLRRGDDPTCSSINEKTIILDH